MSSLSILTMIAKGVRTEVFYCNNAYKNTKMQWYIQDFSSGTVLMILSIVKMIIEKIHPIYSKCYCAYKKVYRK